MSKTMSIYAEALIFNRDLKRGRINGKSVGVAEATAWDAMVKACLEPAYTVRKFRWDNMGNAEVVPASDLTAVYNAIRPIIKLIGEVNGDTLNAENVAEEFIAQSMRFRNIDTSNEMAHERCELNKAKNKRDDFEKGELSEEEYARQYAELDKVYKSHLAEVKRLESLPGNCKRIPDAQTPSTFVKNMEVALGDAIKKQTMRPYSEIVAEREKREADRKAKRKANKLAKKQSK